MTTALIWILTPILIIDCLLLGLLVIIQLPKKEAGIGMAFGGGATDALFGAGSGSALTKLTKYTAGIFFALILILSLLNVHAKNQSSSDTMSRIKQGPVTEQPTVPPPVTATSNAPAAGALPELQSLQVSNAPAAAVPASNAPAK